MQTALPRRRRFNLVKSRLPVLLIIILLLYFAISLGFQLNKLWAMQQSIAEMQERVVDLRQENEYLWNRLTILESEGYIEETARERLNLIKPGETRIVPVPTEDGVFTLINPDIKD